MNINLHHLLLFYYVVKAEGISAAVRIIPYGIQQPAVSQQIIQMEDEFGVRLFNRRPFSLTPAGERLYRFISPFFEGLEPCLASLKETSRTLVRLGCPAVISAHYLPELVALLLERYPNIQPNVVELEGTSIYGALLNREIDIAITMAALPRSKAIETKKLLTIPLCMVLPEDHLFLKEGFWPKSDFAKVKWIALQEQTGATRDLREGLSQFGISPEFVASTNSVEAVLNYVSMGLGIALMARPPKYLLTPKRLKALPVVDIFGQADLRIAWCRNLKIDDKIIKYVLATACKLTEKYKAEFSS